MSELAKTHIEIIDESSYGAGASAIIPLYVFATEQDKVIDEETGEIAPGTVKKVANEVLILTSRKDVSDTYGIPQFVTVDGTVQQGNELNEVGLYGLYDALGNSSIAYAIRADIDLKQLKPTTAEPKGNVPNLTLWFDRTNTKYGLFKANGNARSAQAWEEVTDVLLPEEDSLNPQGKPMATYGSNGDIAAVCDNKEIRIYENILQQWYLIGSEEWKEQYPSELVGAAGGEYLDGAKIVINDVEVTLSGTTLVEAAEAINEAMIAAEKPEISAEAKPVADGELTAYSLVISSEKGIVTVENGDENDTLASLGFEAEEGVAKGETVSFYFSTHTRVPSGKVAGSVWLKTTTPNNGAQYIMKQYRASRDSWNKSLLPIYGSYIDAEADLASSLDASTRILRYDSSVAKMKAYEYSSYGLKITASATATIDAGDAFSMRTVIDGEIKTFVITANSSDVADLVTVINNAKIDTIVADLDRAGCLRIESKTGNTIDFENVTAGKDVLGNLGISEGEINKWQEAEYIADIYEPTTDAPEGTLWFDDTFKVDIMVDDGDEWKGYKNMYPNCEIFLTSEEPLKQSDGSKLEDNDLWINTAAADYPEINRYFSGEWELIDTTDQTTALGIVFADARENAGPSYDGSTHTAFSTKAEDLMISDYVDPETVNPQSYPAGILLFNTCYSTNNVKEFSDKYVDAVKDLGSTFKVGNSKSFATPGSSSNTKTTRWSSASGNATDGAGLFGRKAQRTMIVRALAKAINVNEDIRSNEYDFFYACCPGYPELDDELLALNTEKREMFYIVSDTPARLKPSASEIIAWATNKNNAAAHGEEGRVLQSAYMTRQYPPMGLTSNVDGADIAVPSSIAKMKNLLVLPRGMFAAGTQYGAITNLASVGYIDDEEEYAPVSIREGIGNIITTNKMNPIMPQRGTGLLIWGENTENPITSSLSDEHAILTLLRLKRELEAACLPFFFRPNTEALRKDFDATLRSILNDYVGREELYDYVLVTDRSVNTAERIERKELWAEMAIEIVKGVEQIYIPIRIVKTGSLSNS